MQAQKYKTDELLLVEHAGESHFAVFVKESNIRDRNIQVQLIKDYSKIWIRESQII